MNADPTIYFHQLITGTAETREVDYKARYDWRINADRLKILKGLAAFANHDGGWLVLGVNEIDGVLVSTGLPADIAASFDTTILSTFSARFFDPPLDVEVHQPVISDNRFVCIRVNAFSTTPHIVKIPLVIPDGPTYQPGALIIRGADKASRSLMTSHEMHEVLERAITRRSGPMFQKLESLIHSVSKPAEAVVDKSYTPSQLSLSAKPKDTKSLLDHQIDIANESFRAAVATQHGPASYFAMIRLLRDNQLTDTVPKQGAPWLKETIFMHPFQYRGNPFPFTWIPEGQIRHPDMIEYVLDDPRSAFGHMYDYYSLADTGSWIWIEGAIEDRMGKTSDWSVEFMVAWVTAVLQYSIWLLGRWPEATRAQIFLQLRGTAGRTLKIFNRNRAPFHFACISKTDVIEPTVDIVTRDSDISLLAKSICKQIFFMFGLDHELPDNLYLEPFK